MFREVGTLFQDLLSENNYFRVHLCLSLGRVIFSPCASSCISFHEILSATSLNPLGTDSFMPFPCLFLDVTILNDKNSPIWKFTINFYLCSLVFT